MDRSRKIAQIEWNAKNKQLSQMAENLPFGNLTCRGWLSLS